MQESLWFTTRSALFRPGDAAWNEVSRYAEPLRRLLARRYAWLGDSDRDDLLQDILIEMKERLVAAHDRSRGRFRALLQTVVKRRVADRLRKVRPASLDSEAAVEVAAPAPEEVEALDLESSLLQAVAACRDRFTQGRHKDPDVLYALVDRLVHGKSNVEISRANNVSVDRVARLLRRGREAIFDHLLTRELELPPGSPGLQRAVDVFKQALRKPGTTTALLDQLQDSKIREALETFLTRFRSTLPLLSGDGSARGQELARGLELIFEERSSAD